MTPTIHTETGGSTKRLPRRWFATTALACAVTVMPSMPGRTEGQGSPIFGVTIPMGYRQWEVIAPSHEAGLDELRLTLIDYSTGGSIDGSIRAAEANLAATTDRTIIIPGHGQPISNRTELQAFRDMLVGIRDNVAALKRQGMSLAEIVAARPTASWDAKWGGFVIDPAFFTRLVAEGV